MKIGRTLNEVALAKEEKLPYMSNTSKGLIYFPVMWRYGIRAEIQYKIEKNSFDITHDMGLRCRFGLRIRSFNRSWKNETRR